MRIISILITVMVAVVIIDQGRADVIPPDHHYVDRCVTITNVDSFPDIAFFGVITGPMIPGYEWYVIDTARCLSKGYKFNVFYVVWAYKSYVAAAGIDTMEIEALVGRKKAAGSAAGIYLLTDQINPGGYYVPDSDPLVEEDAYYTLLSNKSDELEIYLSKQVTRYNDGSPEKTETFSASLIGLPGYAGALKGRPEMLVSPTNVIFNIPRAGFASLSIFSVAGLKVYYKEIYCKQTNGNVIALPQLVPGVYMFKLNSVPSTITKHFLILR